MGYCCRIFSPAQPVYPAASVRDFLSGAYNQVLIGSDTTKWQDRCGGELIRRATV
jgi:hypothetical protein